MIVKEKILAWIEGRPIWATWDEDEIKANDHMILCQDEDCCG